MLLSTEAMVRESKGSETTKRKRVPRRIAPDEILTPAEVQAMLAFPSGSFPPKGGRVTKRDV